MNDRDTYEERMKEMDELFEEWWEDEEAESAIEARQDEAGFPYPPDHFLVSRDAAYNIWCIAYRAGGHLNGRQERTGRRHTRVGKTKSRYTKKEIMLTTEAA